MPFYFPAGGPVQPTPTNTPNGTGDLDVPYEFGRKLSADWTFPFSTIQFARILIMRSRLSESADLGDRSAAA